MKTKDYIHFVAHCPTIEELWEAHVDKMGEFGFDRLIYGFTRYRTTTSLGDPQDFVILTNHSRAYTDSFLDGGLYSDAPMLNWALENDGARSWGMLAEQAEILSETEKKVLAFNHAQDVTAGYTVSFKSVSARSKGAIALTARAGLSQTDVDAVWAEHGRDIQLMNDIAHIKILTLPYHSPARALTARQREALEWVGDGKTTQDIAMLMGLTGATVEKHLRLAREVLSVETTAQAVLKAAFNNQMFILEA